MATKEEIKLFRERRAQILEIYEAGVGVTTISRELGLTRTRVYQILEKAKKDRESEERTVEADE